MLVNITSQEQDFEEGGERQFILVPIWSSSEEYSIIGK